MAAAAELKRPASPETAPLLSVLVLEDLAMAVYLLLVGVAIASCFAAHRAVLLVAGMAQRFQVSSVIGAFLVGIAVSGPLAKRSYRLFEPLRDLFAATFFVFVGLTIDRRTLVPAIPVALALGAATTVTKVLTGYWAAAGKVGIEKPLRMRAGAALVARGEFSIVIAGLARRRSRNLGPSGSLPFADGGGGPTHEVSFRNRIVSIWQREKSLINCILDWR
jgi:CPA2 family monovalent cation:H+ antiporter-2